MEPNLNIFYLSSASKWGKKNKYHPKLNDKSSLQESLAELRVYVQKLLQLNADELLQTYKKKLNMQASDYNWQHLSEMKNEKPKTTNPRKTWWTVPSLEFRKTPLRFSRNFRGCWSCRELQFKTKHSLTPEQSSVLIHEHIHLLLFLEEFLHYREPSEISGSCLTTRQFSRLLIYINKNIPCQTKGSSHHSNWHANGKHL